MTNPDSKQSFVKTMAQLNVTPLNGPAAQPRKRDASSDQDRELFLSALNDELHPPDPPARTLTLEASKLKLAKKSTFDVQEVLDLHGNTRTQALQILSRFVIQAFTNNVTSLIVVTGKGKHNAMRAPVLKPTVESWIKGPGARFVHSYAEAPRAMGGAGALVLYLRGR